MRLFSKSVAALLLSAAAVASGTGCRRLAEHPLIHEAVEEVTGNARVAETLGAPVSCSSSVRGTANETDGIAMLQFDVTGPKGAGIVVVEGKKTRNEWGVTRLELQPAAGDVLKLTGDLAARTGSDTPAFDPTATPATSSAVPPADIEIALPPGPQ
jgi:hypothetical protein